MIEGSEIKEEIKFRADFSVSVSDKEEAIILIETIATLNGTELRPRTKEMRKERLCKSEIQLFTKTKEKEQKP